MVSKIEILAYYVSLGFDTFFIYSLAVRIGNPPPVNNPGDVTSILLDIISFAASLMLMLLDISTLRNVALETTLREKVLYSDDDADKSYAIAYMIDSRLEMMTLVAFTVTLVVVAITDTTGTDQSGIMLNVVFGVIDYILVAVRSSVRLNLFTKEQSFDVLELQYWDNLFPFNLVVFTLFALFDGLRAIVFFPFTLRWSLNMLFEARWLPEFATDPVVPTLTSGLQNVT